MRRPKAEPGAAPNRGNAAAGRAANEQDAADAADIELLLQTLSELRLSLSADLTTSAGALEADRPDIASEVVAGARADLKRLRRAAAEGPAALRRDSLVTTGAGFGALPEDDAAGLPVGEGTDAPDNPRQSYSRLRQFRPTGWKGKIVVGAMALVAAVTVLPQMTGGGTHPQQPATAAGTDHLKLASAEFAALRQSLQASQPSAAAVLVAGQRWQRALANDLLSAAGDATTAKRVVTQLREERTLLRSSAAQHNTAQMRATAVALGTASENLFTKLRQLAAQNVLGVLPAVLDSLPIVPPAALPQVQPKTPKTPKSGNHGKGKTPTTPGTVPSPPTSTQLPGTQPTTPNGSPGQTKPGPTVPNLPVPLPSLPNPLPSVLSPVTGLLPTSDTSSPAGTTGGLTGSVTGTLNTLGGLLNGG